MDINFIVSPIVGGVIGGFANWLAIQMLFFPLTEKRFFGMKIPFTPGIVPKERKRIAQSVGETVSNYFLSEEVIVNAVISPEMEKQFKSYIKEIIYSKKDSEETVGQLIKSMSEKDESKIALIISPYISDFIESQLKSQEIIDIFTKSISNYIDDFSNKKVSEMFSQEKLETFKIDYSNKIYNFLSEDNVKEYLFENVSTAVQKVLKSKSKLKDIMPEELLKELKIKAFVNADKVASVISEYITSSTVQFKIRKTLKNKFDESFKLRMISKVVDVEKIFESMLEEIILFLEHSDSHKEIGNFIVQWIDKLSERKIKELVETYDIDFNSLAVREIILRNFDSVITRENIEKLFLNLSNSINDKTIKELLTKFNITLLDKKEEFISNFLKENINLVNKNLINEFVGTNLKNFMNIKISKLIQSINEKQIEAIQKIIIDNLKNLIKAESDRIIKVLDVSKIVEDRINAFDVGEMEGIMLGIIKKDIMTMRVFEAGIGFLIGFIIPAYPYVIKYILQIIR